MDKEQLDRLDAELERAKRRNDGNIIRVLLRIKHGAVYGQKEGWKPKLKEDWDD